VTAAFQANAFQGGGAPVGVFTFDSGLGAPIRTLVRNAVLNLLSGLVAPAGFFEALIPIGFYIEGPNDDHGIDLLMNELRGKANGVAVACGEMALSPAGGPERSRGEIDIEIYVYSTHRTGMTIGRTSGDAAAGASVAADQGLDAATELVWQALFNTPLGIGKHVQTPIQRRERQIIANNEMTIWHQQWQVTVTRDVNHQRAVVQKVVDAKTTQHLQGTEASPNIVEITTVG
jgi:hypothetical protein